MPTVPTQASAGPPKKTDWLAFFSPTSALIWVRTVADFLGLIPESTEADARAGTDSAAANDGRMTPRRTRQAIESVVGPSTNDGIWTFAGSDWALNTTDSRGVFWATSDASGAPTAGNRRTAWSSIAAGAGTLMVGSAPFTDDGDNYGAPLAAGPSGDVLYLEAGVDIAGRGTVSFTPDANGWTKVGAGNAARWYANGVFAIIHTLSESAAAIQMSGVRPSDLTMAVHPYEILHPPWLRAPASGRTDKKSYVQVAADGSSAYADPLAPLGGATTDRYADFAAVAPGDSGWAGDVRGYWGISTAANGPPVDAGTINGWSAITAGRRLIWIAKSVNDRQNLGVYTAITSAQVGAIRHIRNAQLGGPGIDLANLGAVTEVGAGNAAYYWFLADVTLDGALVGGYGECGFHAVQPTSIPVAIDLPSVVGARALQRRAFQWVSGRAYLSGEIVRRPNDKVFLCKTSNSDAAFTASKWTDLTSNVASGIGAAQTNGDIGESWEDISTGHASGDVLGITVAGTAAGTVSYTRSIMQVFSSISTASVNVLTGTSGNDVIQIRRNGAKLQAKRLGSISAASSSVWKLG